MATRSLSGSFERLDLADEEYVVSDPCYETHHDVDLVHCFYLENAIYRANEKITVLADYWMKLYSNYCLQRGEALKFLRVEALKALEDWPEAIGCPKVSQLLPVEQGERTKHKNARKTTDVSCLVQEMRSKFVPGYVQVQQEVPNEEPGDELTLEDYERKIRDCENCHLKNAFIYGLCLNQAF